MGGRARYDGRPIRPQEKIAAHVVKASRKDVLEGSNPQ